MSFRCLLTGLVLMTLPAVAQKPFAVVELFTSEGCSSCPPAEKVMAALKAESEKKHTAVYFLEYHVDYWNRLGWKDPYSSFQNTLRQKNYTSVLSEESIYTPMMVVNGVKSFTGSDASRASAEITTALSAKPEVQFSIGLDSVTGDTAFVWYKSSKTDKNHYVRLVFTESKLVSSVAKGENAGKTLSHESVVRVFFGADANASNAQLRIPLKKFRPGKNTELIGFIQHKQTMKILAAASSPVN